MELRAVLFDLDGVLADTLRLHEHTWSEVAARLGIPFPPQVRRKLRGLPRRSGLEALLGDRRLPEDEMAELLDFKNDLFIEHLTAMGPQDLMPGALDLLTELRAAGILIGLASSSANAHAVAARLGLDGFMDAIADRYRVPRLKPAPDIFLQTAAELGKRPQDCAVIEDSEAGVAAGRAAGMCVIGIARPGRLPSADAVFPDLRAVPLGVLRQVYSRWRERTQTGSDAAGPQPTPASDVRL